MTTDHDPSAPPAPPAPPPATCQNCGAPLLGEHCYACGQPVHGLVRHFSTILGDVLDSVFNLDTRVFRTLWPLYARPGYLSCEYFEGHRVRFVSPVRLFFFLSIVTFFVAQLALDFGDKVVFNDARDDGIAAATTVAEVERRRDQTLAELAKARADAGGNGVVAGTMRIAEEEVRGQAERRIAQLRAQGGTRAAPAAAASTVPAAQTSTAAPAAPAADADQDEETLSFNGRPWDPETNPITVSWLPTLANRWLNTQVGHARDNINRLKRDPNLFKDAVLGAVPSTLFVLMPVFALMLKVAYAFRRRLYMEHLIVALHSHAFLCLSLLLVILLSALDGALPPGAALHAPVGLLTVLVWVWMPVYLLLMQKRVYGQGWGMTLLKYLGLGFCYVILLSLGAAATMLASLVWM